MLRVTPTNQKEPTSICIGRAIFIEPTIKSIEELITQVCEEQKKTGQPDPMLVWPFRRQLLGKVKDKNTFRTLGLNQPDTPWVGCDDMLKALSKEYLGLLKYFYEEFIRILQSRSLTKEVTEFLTAVGQSAENVIKSCRASIAVMEEKIPNAKPAANHGKPTP